MRFVISGRRGVCGAVLGSLVLALSACSSSKHATATTAKHAKLISVAEEELPKIPPDVLNMGHFNRRLHVDYLTLVNSGKRRAAVIQLFDVTRLQANVPVLIHVTGPMREVIYSNGGAGLDPTIQHIGLLLPGHDAWWVDDQISAEWPAGGFNVRVGTSSSPIPHPLPSLATTGVKLEHKGGLDTVGGTLVNRSGKGERNVVISAVVLKQKQVVGAGRTVVRALAPSPARAAFHIALVGTPKGGRVELSVMPTAG